MTGLLRWGADGCGAANVMQMGVRATSGRAWRARATGEAPRYRRGAGIADAAGLGAMG